MLPSTISNMSHDQKYEKLKELFQVLGIDVDPVIRDLLPKPKKPKVPNAQIMEKAEAKRLRKTQKRLISSKYHKVE